jgi:thiosulfate/3-mercaptopyruvate sulfurtransferase
MGTAPFASWERAAGQRAAIASVSTTELLSLLGQAHVRVIDVRDREPYAAGHVPGAVWLAPSRLDASGALAGPVQFAASMIEIGVDDADTVIVYDDGAAPHAQRLVRALHRYGHDRARVLEGGFARWRRRALPVSLGSAAPRAASFTARVPAL